MFETNKFINTKKWEKFRYSTAMANYFWFEHIVYLGWITSSFPRRRFAKKINFRSSLAYLWYSLAHFQLFLAHSHVCCWYNKLRLTHICICLIIRVGCLCNWLHNRGYKWRPLVIILRCRWGTPEKTGERV